MFSRMYWEDITTVVCQISVISAVLDGIDGMSDSGRFTSSSQACFTITSEDDDEDEEDDVTVTSRASKNQQGRCSHLFALLASGTLKNSLKKRIPDHHMSGDLGQQEGCDKFAHASLSEIDEGITDVDTRDDLDDCDHDSGVVVSSEDEAESETEACTHDCFCIQMKSWLLVQATKQRNILDDDFYQASKATVWIDKVLDRSHTTYDPYPSLMGESFRYAGERDRFGRIHQHGSIYFPNGRKFVGTFQHGVRQGPGELIDREGSRLLSGNYFADQLEGVCIIAGNDGTLREMVFHKGVPHGPARRFTKDGILHWVGRYAHGLPQGMCWRSNDNEGWYVGPTNKYGRVTGDQIVYLFPDFHTALIGKWDNECMKEAHEAKVIGLQLKDGYPCPVLGARNTSVPYTLDVSGYSIISTQPLLPDPYETKQVTCSDSSVESGGDGLFAACDIPADTVLSFYNGVRFHDCHAFNDWNHNSYKIRLNEKKKQILDIPPEYRSLTSYSASLAHKVNHSFFPNARFSDYCHPRFGRILCVKSTKRIRKGAEIFCNYGYNLADSPEWYKDLHDSLFFDKCASILGQR